MKKKVVLYTIISCAITLIPMLIGLALWDKLPDKVPTNFGMNGEVNGYSSKFFAVVGLPLIIVALNILCVVFTMADPRRKNISAKVWAVVLAIIPITSIFCGVIMYKEYLNINVSIQNFSSVFLGLVFVVMGLILPKCKQNYTVGIRLPWTLNSEENWNKTHSFIRKLWTIGGIAMTILGLSGFQTIAFISIFILVAIPMIYSYVYYIKNERD